MSNVRKLRIHICSPASKEIPPTRYLKQKLSFKMFNFTEDSDDIEIWSQYIKKNLSSESKWAIVMFVTSLMIIFLMSIIGNLLSCIVICSDKTMHTATNYYLLNLAASDFIVTFGIIFEINEHISTSYRFGRIGCKIHFFLVLLLWNSSILTITALAIERYIAIWHPLMLKSTPVWRRVMKIITLIWVLAVVETAPELRSIDLVESDKSSLCFYRPTPYARVLNGVLALVTFVIPLIIMMFVYTMIAVKVSRMEKKTTQKTNKIFNHPDNSSKVNKLIIALTLSFVVCWLPFTTVRVLMFLFNVRQLMRMHEYVSVVYKLLTFNSWFGMVLNPVLFSLMSNKFRKALKAFWMAKFRRRQNSGTRIYITAV